VSDLHFKRADKVAHLLQQELAAIISQELKDPRVGFVTVTELRLTDDLRFAKAFISVYGTDKQVAETLTALNEARSFLRRELGNRVKLRYAPDIAFELDKTLEHAIHLEKIFSTILGKDNEILSEDVVPVETSRTALAEKVKYFQEQPMVVKKKPGRSKIRRRR